MNNALKQKDKLQRIQAALRQDAKKLAEKRALVEAKKQKRRKKKKSKRIENASDYDARIEREIEFGTPGIARGGLPGSGRRS